MSTPSTRRSARAPVKRERFTPPDLPLTTKRVKHEPVLRDGGGKEEAEVVEPTASAVPVLPLFHIPIELKTMSQLVQERPHLGLDATGAPLCPTARLSSSSSSSRPLLSSVVIQRKQWRDKAVDFTRLPASSAPVLQAEYDALLANLRKHFPPFPSADRVVHRGECTSSTPSTIQSLVRTPRPNVSLRTAEHESTMLKESGEWAVQETGYQKVVFPPCSSGSMCMAASFWQEISGLDRPIVLMASMDESQYALLLQQGQAPDTFSALCVLCSRHQLHYAQVEHRSRIKDGQPTPSQQAGWRADDPLVDSNTTFVQSYYNLKHAPGGYHEWAMLESNPKDDPMFQPIVSANLSMLTAHQSDDEVRGTVKRWIINQAALVYTGHDRLTPLPGERVSDFVQRSKEIDVHETATAMELAAQRSRASLVRDSVLSLLLRQPTNGPLHYDKDTRTLLIDREACTRWMTMESASPHVSLAAARLHDVVALQQHTAERMVVWNADDDGWTRLATDRLVHPSAIHHTLQSAFFVPLTDIATALHYLISKCGVPMRCNVRKLSDMIQAKLIDMNRAPRHDTRGRRAKGGKTNHTTHHDWQADAFPLHVVKQMVLCALLGMYTHSVPHSRPPPDVRKWLYRAFTEDRYNRWVTRLFQHCPFIVFVSIRTYVTWVLRTTPALYQHVHAMMMFDSNHELNEHTLVQLRACFVRLWQDTASPLHAQLKTLPPKPCAMVCFWHQVLSKKERQRQQQQQQGRRGGTTKLESQARAASHAQTRALDDERRSGWSRDADALHALINEAAFSKFQQLYSKQLYRRPKMQIIKDLLPMRKPKYSPLIPLRRQQPLVQTDADAGAEEEEEEDMANNDLYSDEVKHQHEPSIDEPGLYVTESHVAALHELVTHCGPVGFGNPFPRLLQALPVFGISTEVTQRLLNVFKRYQEDGLETKPLTKPKLQNALCELRCTEPYAYNLVHVMAELLERARRRIHLSDLPLHITAYQLEAIRRSHGLEADDGHPWHPRNVVLDSSLSFVYCHVCWRVYSQINDANSVYKYTWVLGLRDAHVSYLTNKTYCKGTRHNTRGRCGQEELARIPLLGRVLWFGSKVVMLCPQAECGRMMAFDTKDEQYLHYNERGPACVSCTMKLSAPEQRAKDAQRLIDQHDITCLLCADDAPPIHARKAHMYEGNHFVCHTHHSPELREYVLQQLANFGGANLPASMRSDIVRRTLQQWALQQQKQPQPGRDAW